jgi:hypothetical protein
MDLVTAVILCNCAISIGCFVATILMIRFRRQVVALKDCCDRWTLDCDRLSNAPASICSNAAQIDHLRQIYQQQLVTLDKLRAVGWLLGMSRSLLFKRR